MYNKGEWSRNTKTFECGVGNLALYWQTVFTSESRATLCSLGNRSPQGQYRTYHF
ncbi:hypothetical protein M404DRAFT_999283 [Pisolithus tinctorius Marx 270]|uniref:Uncharacterized protein n=1 Tax=Pisolithus tinctorius Marx 270 TaxID=870435 RepID=A0A0C3K8Y7_PISTI|nr:hypothetical protein M404DRAFT_999283 [Pisolithus tinctorius Marx 270]